MTATDSDTAAAPTAAATPVPDASRPQFACLDGLRAIAAVSVLAHHVGFDTGATFRLSSLGGFVARMDIGVSIFFALSGFLLFRPMVVAIVDDRPLVALAEFWKRRVLRIFPAYWLALLVIVVSFGRTLHDLGDVVVFGGLLQIYDPDRFLGGLVQAWSLCTEISFYLVLPLYALMMRRIVRGRTPALRLRTLLAATAVLYLVGVVWRMVLLGTDPPGIARIGLHWLPGQIDHFAIGMALGVLTVWAGHSSIVRERFDRALGRPWVWWLGAAAAFWMVSVPLDVPRGLAEMSAGTDLARQFLYGLVALLLLVPLVFEGTGVEGTGVGGGVVDRDPSRLRRFLGHRVMWWMGVMSYGIYLWHKDLIAKVQLAFGWDNFQGNWFVVFGVTLVASTAIAALSYYLLEQPILLRGRSGSGRAQGNARRTPTVWTGLLPSPVEPGFSSDRSEPVEPVEPGRSGAPSSRSLRLAPRRARSWTQRTDGRFRRRVLMVTATGLALRLCYLWLSRRGIYDCPPETVLACAGDSYVYHEGANLIADGQGFVSPLGLLDGNRFPGADHPPLYWLYLATYSVVGLDSYTWHQIATVLAGVAAIPVAALLGREIRGPRLGLAAAIAVAVYPNIWINDALVLSETLTILLVLVVALTAYRVWRRPSPVNVAMLGLAAAAGALTRAEVVLVYPLVVLPLLARHRALDGWGRRIGLLALAGGVGLVAMAPWLIRNQQRFEEPVYLSTGLGVTLSYANCDQTYSGPLIGFWWFECKGDVDLQAQADQSVIDKELRSRALDYVEAHKDRLPAVLAARLGRTWGLYKVNQIAYLDTLEHRPLWATRLGAISLYPAMAFAALGALVLRRRRIPVYPLLVPLGIVTFAVLLTFSQTRYRSTAEGPLAVLAAVGVLRALDVARARRRARQAADIGQAPSAVRP